MTVSPPSQEQGSQIPLWLPGGKVLLSVALGPRLRPLDAGFHPHESRPAATYRELRAFMRPVKSQSLYARQDLCPFHRPGDPRPKAQSQVLYASSAPGWSSLVSDGLSCPGAPSLARLRLGVSLDLLMCQPHRGGALPPAYLTFIERVPRTLCNLEAKVGSACGSPLTRNPPCPNWSSG